MVFTEFGKLLGIERFCRAEPFLDAIESNTLEMPSLILLDLRMPGFGGLDVLKRLKKSSRYRRVPAVVLSTSTNPDEVAMCYGMRANAFHSKLIETPAMIRLLVSILNYWLGDVVLTDFGRIVSNGQ